MSLIVIDPSLSGAAGDMLIAAILDMVDDNKRDNFCKVMKSHLHEFDPEFYTGNARWR